MDRVTDTKFKDILGELHKTLLKQNGFKKTGSNFRQYLPNGLCKIINFQKSMYNSDGECRFTMNLGIYFEKNPDNPNRQFKEYECQICTRVSGVSKRYSGDHWWIITPASDNDQLYGELFVLLSEDVLPWLEQFSSRQAAIRMGQTGALNGMIRGSIY